MNSIKITFNDQFNGDGIKKLSVNVENINLAERGLDLLFIKKTDGFIIINQQADILCGSSQIKLVNILRKGLLSGFRNVK